MDILLSEQVADLENVRENFKKIRKAFKDAGGGTWGSITGTLSDQTDLQAALDSKEEAITPGTTSQYWRGDKTWQAFDSAVLGSSLAGLSITGGAVTSSDNVLAAFGKLQNQINGILGGATYQGVWNATTNSPALASGVGTKGYYYVVSVNGSTNLDGITDWKVGDWAIFNGTTWDKVDNTDAVSSVNGAIGAISLAGTADRISVTGTTFDIASTYAGQASIITVGTIGTGIWQGTPVASGFGGTGFSSYAAGDIIYASAINTLAKLAATTDGYVLTLASGLPVWAAASSGGGGIYPGTGAAFTSYATGDIIYASATNTLSKLPIGLEGKVLNITSGLPSWGNIPIQAGALLADGTIPLTANWSTGAFTTTIDFPNLTRASNIGISLMNSSHSTSSSQVGYSPILMFTAQGWNFDSLRTLTNKLYYNIDSTGWRGHFVSVAHPQAGADVTLFDFRDDGLATISGATIQSGAISASSFGITGYVSIVTSQSTFANGIRVVSNVQGNQGFYWNPTSYGSSGAGSATTIWGLYLNPSTNITTIFTDVRAIQTTVGNCYFCTTANSVGIGANMSLNASAILDITSTTQGVLFPRMTTTQKTAIASAASGLVVFDITLQKLCVKTNTAWETISSS